MKILSNAWIMPMFPLLYSKNLQSKLNVLKTMTNTNWCQGNLAVYNCMSMLVLCLYIVRMDNVYLQYMYCMVI